MKITVITPIPTPYRDPLWCELDARAGVELQVLYCAESKSDRPWDLAWERPPNSESLPAWNFARWRGAGGSCFWNPAIRNRLARQRPDAVIVGGYNHPTMLWSMRYADRNGVPYYLMSESHLEKRRGRMRRALKAPLVRRVVSRAAGGFPTGQLASQYLMRYGARRSDLCAIPNVPDVEWFAERARELRPARAQFRREHDLSDAPLALFAGRLLPFKGADTLLTAFAAATARCAAQLVIIGDGPQMADLRRASETLGIADRVRFIGFVQPTEMPQWYAAADLFALPSSETWGVVVLEALASGLPVVITDEVGCHADVLNDERVGEAVPARSAERLADALVRRLSRRIGPEAVAEAWSPVFDQMRYSAIVDRMLVHLQGHDKRSEARTLAVAGRGDGSTR